MMTIKLDDETTALLQKLMAQEHLGAEQLVKTALTEHLEAKRGKPALLTDVAGLLAGSPSFQGDPLAIQKAMRDEWG